MSNQNNFYPLTKGNKWIYRMPDGLSFTNTVVSEDGPDLFTLNNSLTNTNAIIQRQGNSYLTDSYEKGTMLLLLRDDMKMGDIWEIKFKANGFDNILVMAVKEVIPFKSVEGKDYADVIMIESESKIVINGNMMSVNYFTQYYYAKGIGLILTTTLAGDYMPLVAHELQQPIPPASSENINPEQFENVATVTSKQDFARIKNRWQEIKQNDPNCLIPGSQFHKYHLDEENIPRQSIEVFEKKHGCSLPEDYKEYLIQVSNGGVGPYNIMYPLQEALYPLSRVQKGNESHYDWLAEHPNHYTAAFPVTEDKIISSLKYKIANPTAEAPPIVINTDAPGYLFICTAEPGIHYIMPINGTCEDEIWLMKEAYREGEDGEQEACFHLWPAIKFINDKITTMSFLEWIEDAQQDWFNQNKSLSQRLAAVKITWHNLAAYDHSHNIFGAFMHRYQLRPVLTEQEIIKAETLYHFTLPETYRHYLMKVSNGGVGPFYGLYAFEDTLIALNSGNNQDGDFINYKEAHPQHLSMPFPISGQQVTTYLMEKVNNPSVGQQPILMDIQAGGYLFLAEYGCGGYYIMPVNGNNAGEVWFLQKMDANKLSYELTDANGNVIQSGSYEDSDEDKNYFQLYPELKWDGAQASTVNFLEWIEYRQSIWFAEAPDEA